MLLVSITVQKLSLSASHKGPSGVYRFQYFWYSYKWKIGTKIGREPLQLGFSYLHHRQFLLTLWIGLYVDDLDLV